MRFASKFAEQALASLGPCALARPWSSQYGVGARAGAFIVGAVDHSYLITLLHLRLTMPSSAVRPLAPPVYPAGYLRRVGHIGGPAVRGGSSGITVLARVDSTEQELGNYDVARVDPTERELGNCNEARVDPTERELGNWGLGKS
ncbi:hypothetical protein BHE74_00050356 [Ensete ventricosum]|nr:hypothetical protein BHE74_00050356 [Ensete ventricosum]